MYIYIRLSHLSIIIQKGKTVSSKPNSNYHKFIRQQKTNQATEHIIQTMMNDNIIIIINIHSILFMHLSLMSMAHSLKSKPV